jgi:TPR repeat protein
MVNTDVLFSIGDAAEEAGNFDLARQSFERGAALGSAECMSRLAYLFDVGAGVPADKALAMRLYQQAWRRGSHVAANNIAILYREQGKLGAMFRWFQKAALNGDGSAQLDMAKCYLDGIGVRRNPQAAIRCLSASLNCDYISEAEREEASELMEALRPRVA